MQAKELRGAVSPQAMSILSNYSWPGNIRQLENVIQYGIARGFTRVLLAEDLPDLRETAVMRSDARTLHQIVYDTTHDALERNYSPAPEGLVMSSRGAALECSLGREPGEWCRFGLASPGLAPGATLSRRSAAGIRISSLPAVISHSGSLNAGIRLPSMSVKPYSSARSPAVRIFPDFSSTFGSAASATTARPAYSGDSVKFR